MLYLKEVEASNGVENHFEQYQDDFDQWEKQVSQPLVLSPDEFVYEQEVRLQSGALLASVALDASIEVCCLPERSLMQASKDARHSEEARSMVVMNAKTDYIERTYKSGHVTRVTLGVENGQLGQHGQYMTSVNANSLRYLNDEILRSRARIETHNAFRQQKYYNEGLLENYTMVTFSLVPQNMQPAHAAELGFFTENMSVAIQAVGSNDGHDVVLESAFVAGADSPEDKRFDINVVKELMNHLGVDVSTLDTEQLLAHPILISNDVMRNGVIDIVKMYDDIATQTTGRKRFYGRKEATQADYIEHRLECRRREQVADEVAKRTAKQLINESATFTNPLDATRRLHELNDVELKKLIVTDTTIDSNVLGSAAIEAIEQARIYYASNDMHGLYQAMAAISEHGVSSSCPNGGRFSRDSSVFGIEQALDKQGDDESREISGKKEMTCPFCEEKTVGDPCADCITCTKCSASTKYSVDENVRRAQQYRQLKTTKSSVKYNIETLFNRLISAKPMRQKVAQND